MPNRIPANRGSRWLVAGGLLSAIASLLHIACMIGGPDWFRFFGAGEPVAQAVERGEWQPYLMTSAIVLILALWAAYAFSGAGRIARLPLIRAALVTITFIYLARGLILLPLAIAKPQLLTDPFALWSSFIVAIYGIIYALGTGLSWPALKPSSRQLS